MWRSVVGTTGHAPRELRGDFGLGRLPRLVVLDVVPRGLLLGRAVAGAEVEVGVAREAGRGHLLVQVKRQSKQG